MRSVQDNLLVSTSQPRVRIRISRDFSYCGGSEFILNRVARAEQHLFTVLDETRKVTRLAWFQFEGYLADNEHRYQYPEMQKLKLGGLEFLYDSGLHDIDQDSLERPRSDSAHVVEYLRRRGYLYEGETQYMRYVWLDPVKRNELMIIYAEDLATRVYRISELQPGGAAAAARAGLSDSLHQRAMASFTIEE